jgi:hypothetical protein
MKSILALVYDMYMYHQYARELDSMLDVFHKTHRWIDSKILCEKPEVLDLMLINPYSTVYEAHFEAYKFIKQARSKNPVSFLRAQEFGKVRLAGLCMDIPQYWREYIADYNHICDYIISHQLNVARIPSYFDQLCL